MAGENLVSVKISTELLAEIRDLLTQLDTKLGTVVIALSPEQKKSLPKISNRLLPFVNKVVGYIGTNPEIVPSFVSVEEMKIDVAAVNTLTEIINRLNQIVEPLNDTIILSGSEAYQAGLKIYGNVKALAKANVLGAQTILDDLKVFFARTGKAVETTTQQ